MQRRLPTDWQLQFRMAFTMLLLGALYLAFGAILVHYGAGIGTVGVLICGLALLQFYFSDRLVLLTTGARIVPEGQLPEVADMLGRLAATADLPPPRLALVRSPVPNAFATGRNPRNAVVAVTSGLLDRLPPQELEAVLGHEMTHIRHRDMAVMAAASFFATVAGWIAQNLMWIGMFGGFGGGGFGGGGFGGGNRRDRGGGGNIALVLLASWLVQMISFFLIAALSRYREYAADRGSALLTGQPANLGSALIRISGAMDRIPSQDLRRAQTANALYIIPAVRSREGLMELFMTHPTLEHRLNHLRRLEEELAASGRRR